MWSFKLLELSIGNEEFGKSNSKKPVSRPRA